MSPRQGPPPIVDDNPPKPPPARQPPPEPEPTVEAVLAHNQEVAERDDDSLASMLGEESTVDAGRVISGLVNMRQRTVDPESDYVADGTRLLRYVKAAMMHEAALTGRKVQEVMRDVTLNVRPLPSWLLDAHYEALYGHKRESQ